MTPSAERAPGGEGGRPIGALYLHIPFCHRRCAYCDFTSSALGPDRAEGARRYAASLGRLVGEAAARGLLGAATTAYLGGGTPTVLGGALPPLIATVARSLGGGLGELTFEANPESSSADLFTASRQAGATRVSVGVQSTDDAVLRRLGRLHRAEGALEALSWARQAGLRSSADLMVGVPGQGPGGPARDVARIAERGVGHVSVYALEVHEATPFGALEAEGLLHAPSEDETADLLEEAEGALRAAGYGRYEVSNYARPGEHSRHNLAYWDGTPYLGLGPSAASMVDAPTYGRLRGAVPALPEPPGEVVRLRLTCTSSPDRLAGARSLAELSFEVEGLTGPQALAEDLMLAARLTRGLTPDLIADARALWGAPFRELVDDLVDDGLLDPRGGSLVPTERGWLLGNRLFGALWFLAGDLATWRPFGP